MVTRTMPSGDLLRPVRTRAALYPTHLWLFDTEVDLTALTVVIDDPRAALLVSAVARCAADAGSDDDRAERALARLATEIRVAPLSAMRRALFVAGSGSSCVTCVDDGRHGVTVTTWGAIEAVLPHCTSFLDELGRGVPLTRTALAEAQWAAHLHAQCGRRVLAVGHRAVGVGRPPPADRRAAETELVLLGLIAFADRITADDSSTVG